MNTYLVALIGVAVGVGGALFFTGKNLNSSQKQDHYEFADDGSDSLTYTNSGDLNKGGLAAVPFDWKKRAGEVLAISNQSPKHSRLAELFWEWASTDFDGAWAYINTISNRGDREVAEINALLSRLEVDPAGVKEKILSGDVSSGAIMFTVPNLNGAATFSKGELEALLKQVESDDSTSAKLASSVLDKEIASKDPIGGLQQALIDDNKEMQLAAIAALGTDELGDAFSTILKMRNDPSHEVRLLSQIVRRDESMSLESFRKDWADQVARPTKLFIESLLVARMAQTDPTAAAISLETLPLGDARRKASMATALQWAEEDPSAASNWAHSLSDVEGREDILSQLGEKIASIEAVDHQKELERSTSEGFRQSLARQLGIQNPLKNLDSIAMAGESMGLSDGELYAFEDGALSSLLSTAPGHFVDQLKGSLESSQVLPESAFHALDVLARSDPHAASSLVLDHLKLTDTEVGSRSLTNIIATLARRDITATEEFSKKIQTESTRDFANATLYNAYKNTDSIKADQFLDSIVSSEVRDSLVPK